MRTNWIASWKSMRMRALNRWVLIAGWELESTWSLAQSPLIAASHRHTRGRGLGEEKLFSWETRDRISLRHSLWPSTNIQPSFQTWSATWIWFGGFRIQNFSAIFTVKRSSASALGRDNAVSGSVCSFCKWALLKINYIWQPLVWIT